MQSFAKIKALDEIELTEDEVRRVLLVYGKQIPKSIARMEGFVLAKAMGMIGVLQKIGSDHF